MPEFKDELRTILTASFWENVITLFDANRLFHHMLCEHKNFHNGARRGRSNDVQRISYYRAGLN